MVISSIIRCGLQSKDDDFTSIKGYIKFSANLYTNGDKPVVLKDETVSFD